MGWPTAKHCGYSMVRLMDSDWLTVNSRHLNSECCSETLTANSKARLKVTVMETVKHSLTEMTRRMDLPLAQSAR